MLDGPMLARMEISTWRTDAADLDVLTDILDRDGRRRRYDELVERAELAVVQGVVAVASLVDVITSQEWPTGPKNHEALSSYAGCAGPRSPSSGSGRRSSPWSGQSHSGPPDRPAPGLIWAVAPAGSPSGPLGLWAHGDGVALLAVVGILASSDQGVHLAHGPAHVPGVQRPA
jgi:hypothetical protein